MNVASRAKSAHHIFRDHFEPCIGEVPMDRGIVILCSTSTRGSLAASILKKHGRGPINILGGMTGRMHAGLPRLLTPDELYGPVTYNAQIMI